MSWAGPGSEQISGLPRLSANARKVLEARYLKKDEHGRCLEEPAALLRRVARTLAEVELLYGAGQSERREWEERFYRMMAGGTFMPNSPTLMNAGREMGMLSACFVLPVRDSVTDIFDSIKHTALIQKAGGGTGFAFDELRPTGDFIQSSGGTTSGPISFWRAFSEATNAIQQGAFRRGANMGMMYIHHPDILKFLYAKQDLTQFTNYNMSVKITDVWMEELLADPDSPHVVRNPRTGRAYVIPRALDIQRYDIRGLKEVHCVEPVPAEGREKYYRSPRLSGALPAELRGRVYTKRQIWEIIVNNAWQTGEPGVVFMDRINEHNPTPALGRIEATNPCGEQPLLPYEACNLGSINLGRFVRGPGTAEADVDWEALRETVQWATRFLDNVIDANNYPLKQIEQLCRANRKIGLGVMGFADALYKLGVPYNSPEGLAWGERFMRFVNDQAHDYSEQLARCRGCFENWRGSIWQTRHKRMMRNAAVTTVAPSGTISIIADCSGGIEPMFSLAFVRNVLRGQEQGRRPLLEVNGTFRRVAAQRGILSDELLERVAREGTLAHIEGVPEDIKRVFVCAHDISPEWHVRMQAAFQRHCDASISKTINFPASATPSDVEAIYRLAFTLGCKGVTVYRDGCRSFQPMALKKNPPDSRRPAALREPVGRQADRPPAGDARRGSGGQAGRGDGGNGDDEPVAALAPPAPAAAQRLPAAPRQAQCGAAPLEPRDLPEIVSGLRIRQVTPFGNMHVKITVDPATNRELEIFAQLGKGGDVANSDLEGLCRTASLWLRAGGSLRPLIKQWEGIGSSMQIPVRGGRIMSLPDGLACAVKKYLRAKERFGLRALLLGEVDFSELERPPRAPGAAEGPPTQCGAPGTGAALAPGPTDEGGNGKRRAEQAAAANPAQRRDELTLPAAPRGQAARRSGRAGEPQARAAGLGAAHHAAAGHALAQAPATALAELPVELTVGLPHAGGARRPKGNGVPLAAGWTPLRHFHDAALFYAVKCPQCGSELLRQEGCRKCRECGWSAC